MIEEYGIDKAALGIRYLLKYLENGRIENFNVILDCLDEIELWCLITFYSNNIDELYSSVPEHVLKNIFEMVPTADESDIHKLFGRGFKTNSDIPYKNQFKMIRDALCHKDFKFNDGLIYIKCKEYEATFDLIWLEKLVGTTLKSNHFDLQKGMSDFAISTGIDPLQINNENIQEICKNGLVQIYNITSLTSNKESLVKSVRGLDIPAEELTFYDIVEIVKGIALSQQLDSSDSSEKNIEEIKKHCRQIEKIFGNKIKIELLHLGLSDELIQDENFRNLDVFSKFAYISSKSKSTSKESYNYQVMNNLINLFESLKNGKPDNLTLFTLRDATNFLLKVYANIYFGMLGNSNTFKTASKYGIDCHFVHGANIYKDYLKILKRSYEELNTFKGSKRELNSVIKDMETYSELLEEATKGDSTKDFIWHMRNSVTHDHIDFIEDNVRFYTTGRKLKVPKYSKKNKEWTTKEYNNSKPIWEMVIGKEELLTMLDEMYTRSGVEIKVNISKYVKRRNYLK